MAIDQGLKTAAASVINLPVGTALAATVRANFASDADGRSFPPQNVQAYKSRPNDGTDAAQAAYVADIKAKLNAAAPRVPIRRITACVNSLPNQYKFELPEYANLTTKPQLSVTPPIPANPRAVRHCFARTSGRARCWIRRRCGPLTRHLAR